MARHRKVAVAIWNDQKFLSLSDDGQLLFLYLLTHPQQTSLGAMSATMGGLADERGWLPERLSKAFAEITGKGMARYDRRARCLWLPNFLKYNGPESPNVVKAWFGALDLIPECTLKTLSLQRAKAILDDYDQSFLDAFAKSLAKAFPKGLPFVDDLPSPNPEQEPEPYQEQKQKGDIREVAPVENLGTDLAGQSSPTQSNSLDSSQTDEASAAAAKRSTSERRENRTAAELVFKHWQVTWGHEGAKFDSKRRKRIEARLAQGFTVEQLCNAITGFRHSAWHTGTDPNGDGKIYDKIETLLRDAGQVEEGMRLHANPPKANGNGHANGSEAFAAWDRAYDHARKGDWRKGVLGDQRIDRVVAYIGGYQRIAMSNNSEVPFFRQQFIKAWKEGAP